MVSYQVNIQINKSIIENCNAWLQTNVKEMLMFDGSCRAQILGDINNHHHITVQYYVENEDYLNQYFDSLAKKCVMLASANLAIIFKQLYSQDFILRRGARAVEQRSVYVIHELETSAQQSRRMKAEEYRNIFTIKNIHQHKECN